MLEMVRLTGVDDVLERLKPSLEKLKGCDLLDINPGAGIWSSKIHDYLEPRTHILMEPDYKLYQPLLQHLIDAPDSTYKLIPKSGIVWGHLETVITPEYLPFQVAPPSGDPRLEQPNNTLLVIANVSFSPKKPYRGFASLTQMVTYQFLSAMKAHSLFQKYGLVRMLLWINDEEKTLILPRSMASRRKVGIEAEIICSKVEEVASSADETGRWVREHSLILDSARKVVEKMKKSGIQTPPGRESKTMQELSSNGGEARHKLWTECDSFMNELRVFERADNSGYLDTMKNGREIRDRMKKMRYTKLSIEHQARDRAQILDEFDALYVERRALATARGPEADIRREALVKREAEWAFEVANLSENNMNEIRVCCQNRLALHIDPPLLLWDRREYEPLKLHKDEFSPQQEMCLLDLQPQSIWPILRKDYPENYDILEYMLSSLFATAAQSLKDGLKGLVPGAYEWIDQECKIIKDPLQGGNPDLSKLCVRLLTIDMLQEMVEAWSRWPFRPSKFEMLSRTGSSVHDPDSDADDLGALGGM